MKSKMFLNNLLFISVSSLLMKSLNSFASIFVGFLGDIFYQTFYHFVFFLLLQTHTHNHQQVSIFCSQISFWLLYLNHFFFIVFILINIIKFIEKISLTFSFRSYFSFVCGISFLRLENFYENHSIFYA